VSCRALSNSKEATSFTSISLPTKELTGRGRFVLEIVLRGGKRPGSQLEYPDRLGEVLDLMLTEIGRRDVGKLPRLPGDQHLAAVAGRSDAGSFVYVFADIALLGEVGGAGVEAQADPDRAGAEGLLGLGGRGHRGHRVREHVEEGIAFSAHLHATMAGEGLAQEPAVLGKGTAVGLGSELVQELGRSLDVGEQQCHHAGGKVISGHAKPKIPSSPAREPEVCDDLSGRFSG
jgi:hypothetical protein